jgi:hypothetical protein
MDERLDPTPGFCDGIPPESVCDVPPNETMARVLSQSIPDSYCVVYAIPIPRASLVEPSNFGLGPVFRATQINEPPTLGRFRRRELGVDLREQCLTGDTSGLRHCDDANNNRAKSHDDCRPIGGASELHTSSMPVFGDYRST